MLKRNYLHRIAGIALSSEIILKLWLLSTLQRIVSKPLSILCGILCGILQILCGILCSGTDGIHETCDGPHVTRDTHAVLVAHARGCHCGWLGCLVGCVHQHTPAMKQQF